MKRESFALIAQVWQCSNGRVLDGIGRFCFRCEVDDVRQRQLELGISKTLSGRLRRWNRKIRLLIAGRVVFSLHRQRLLVHVSVFALSHIYKRSISHLNAFHKK